MSDFALFIFGLINCSFGAVIATIYWTWREERLLKTAEKYICKLERALARAEAQNERKF